LALQPKREGGGGVRGQSLLGRQGEGTKGARLFTFHWDVNSTHENEVMGFTLALLMVIVSSSEKSSLSFSNNERQTLTYRMRLG